jgi:hypothetical protein
VLEEDLEAGREQWTAAWRKFARQWTQPQLLRLADAVMYGRYLHSSQISGFATGKLREPGPKVFVVIGKLNQALAKGKVPPELKDLWEDKEVLRDKEGNPLDSVGCFRAFTGQLDLGMGDVMRIPDGQVEDANKRVGRFVRGELTKAGVDFIEEMPKLVKIGGPLVKPVLLGQMLDADDLAESIEELEAILQWHDLHVTLVHLWDVALETRRHGHYVEDYLNDDLGDCEPDS